MASVTQPLRDEHRELFPHVDSLRAAADAVGEADAEALRAAVDAAYAFLAEHLLVHAQAEEAVLYPVVERVIGAAEATLTMRRDHVEVGRLTKELAALRDALHARAPSEAEESRLRAVLYGLYALVTLHFAKEEEVYLPILDARLPAAEATAMFAAMEKAAGAARVASVR
jgi:iron-sulfur cluster repair protein YtfE (RIC family)